MGVISWPKIICLTVQRKTCHAFLREILSTVPLFSHLDICMIFLREGNSNPIFVSDVTDYLIKRNCICEILGSCSCVIEVYVLLGCGNFDP
jgi:hypothetical protein